MKNLARLLPLLIFPFAISSSRAESVDRTLQRFELLQLTAGATIEEQIQRLSRWSKERLRVDLSCNHQFFSGIGNAECLYGMRNYLLGTLNAPRSQAPEKIAIQIANTDNWKPIDINSIEPQIRIPFIATQLEMTQYLRRQFARPDYAQRLRWMSQIADITNELEQRTKFKFEVSPSVNNLQAVAGLYRLLLLARENPNFLQNQTEVIKLNRFFQLAYEENLKLKSNVGVTADLAELRRFLYEPQQVYGQDPEWFKGFYSLRKDLEQRKQSLQQDLNIEKVECSPLARLSQLECMRSLHLINHALQNKSINKPPINVLIVTDLGELSSTADYYYDSAEQKHVLLIRDDATVPALFDFFVAKGWTNATLARGEP